MMVSWIRVGAVEIIRNGETVNIFSKERQLLLLIAYI
jgi:hypothetical protein